MKESKWNEHVILVDADYVDKVAFDLTVNFERMIGRRISQADMAKWLECVALDGGLREGDHEVQVVLLHKQSDMKYFQPGIQRSTGRIPNQLCTRRGPDDNGRPLRRLNADYRQCRRSQAPHRGARCRTYI